MNNLEQYTKEVAGHYNGEAKEYDEVYTHPIQLAEDQVLMGILTPFVTKGKQVLDIGSGTGLPLTYITIPNYHGIDISEEMVLQAQKDHPGKEFQVGDMHHLPFEDGSMDTVISLFGPLSYSPVPEVVTSEIYRVLKPGGTAIIMPYTQRVGHGLDMGGYSTANSAEIKKEFYDTSTLKKLFKSFKDVSVVGFNYFGNTLAQYDEKMTSNLTQKDFEQYLQFEINHAKDMPDVKYARHAMVIAKKPNNAYSRRGK